VVRVRCIGSNTNKLLYNDFYNLFVKECMLIGTIIKIVGNTNYLLAEVENGKQQ
jgi:hypothetical protein